MMQNETSRPVVASEIPESARLAALPRYFGRQVVATEGAIYDALSKLSGDYNGGYWTFYRLDNGGFYMAPVMDAPVRVVCPGNFFAGDMSPGAAGIVACLFAYNQLCWRTRDERYDDLYYRLRDFASEHPEASLILGAID